ncbi:MAG: succinylglutamate desuccinylase/aspartoacylase family protein [Hyphomicrobiales bacterium]|nr:succinylglutamate desuccinylase/aspartoacylase family protein [Hyphomicrobiales bacterium]
MVKQMMIGGQVIRPGKRQMVSLQIAKLYDFTEIAIPIEVVRGKEDGPVLFVSAAIHGDEINGVAIVKRLLQSRSLRNMRGTLIAVPILNVFGFNTKSRYLPDRRDLNRCFPGSPDGSLASRLASMFMEEVVSHATHGIDLHSGALHRSNLPHVRACLDDPETRRLAEAFQVPVIINSALRDGSLREAARDHKIPMLVFEGGEALRFRENVTRAGVHGILSVMRAIGMLSPGKEKARKIRTFTAHSSYWVRAPHSGMLRPLKKLGEAVKANELLGVVSDPFGEHRFEVRAKYPGIVLGISMLPLLNDGDAVYHIATFEDNTLVEENVEAFQDSIRSQADTYIT